MIVTFCGHACFSKSEMYEHKILDFLEQKVGEQTASMYLGGYGNFDKFCTIGAALTRHISMQKEKVRQFSILQILQKRILK